MTFLDSIYNEALYGETISNTLLAHVLMTKEIKIMNKKERQIVFKKFGGKCAYCGCELKKGWHVDHLQPLYRNLYKPGCMRPENKNKDNLMPSCASCNNYKSTFGLETFRKEIGLLVQRLNKTFTQYKIAKRFGLIEETGIDIEFYFETFKNSNEYK